MQYIALFIDFINHEIRMPNSERDDEDEDDAIVGGSLSMMSTFTITIIPLL
jgi:hypothetical protein